MATIDFKRLETLSKTYEGVLQVKKTVASIDDLPKTGVSVGDVCMVGEENPTPYMWNGESFAPFGGVSKKYVDDQLNGYTDLVPVTGRKLTAEEASTLEIDEPDSCIAIENPAGSGEKKIIIKYPVKDGRFDNTDKAVIWQSMRFAILGNISDEWEPVQPVSHNSNVFVVEGYHLLVIPLNDNGKAVLQEEFGSLSDHAEIVIPDNSMFVFHTGIVQAMDPIDESVEEVQDSGSVVVFTEETISPVARKSYFDGYTEQKQLPVREMTAEEKAALLGKTTEEEAATWGYKTFVAYTNPAGSGEKEIRVKISTESGNYISFWPKVVYADTLIEIEKPDAIFKGSSSYDGIVEFGAVLPENITMLLALSCYATEEDFDNEENPILDATFDIEITEAVEHGRVLREEDVATTEKEANLLGFIELNNTVKRYMFLESNVESPSLGFNEYTAYMQNYGPLNVYPATMASAETIDGLLVDESNVEADRLFKNFVPGYALNSHTDYYTVETEQGTTIYPDKFNCFPSLVCIGKTGDEERWVCINIPDTAGFENYRVSVGAQAGIKHLAVYDAKPKLTQVAASVYEETWA